MKELLKPLDYLRRSIMGFFNKNYVKDKLAARKGKCKKCGKCCENCFYLDKKTNLCKIYYHRPSLACHKDFPLDKVDLWLWNVEKTCGYKFKD